MPGLYIHIPFCKQLCSYCDFYFSVSLMRTAEMLDCMLKEMELKALKGNRFPEDNLPQTLYFGGGTPTVYAPEDLKKLADKAISLYFTKAPVEWTIEANPDDLTDEYLEKLKDIGVNRLSIGIQSFIDRDLKEMKRRHTAEEGYNSIIRAQKAGFNNISIDLIYGFPGMSMSEWEYNLNCATGLNVQHISAYHLSIEPCTILGKYAQKGKIAPIDDEISAEQYELLREKLLAAGFEHYEISNFALPGYYSKHNSLYWHKQPYIGIGPSAHSYNGAYIRNNNVANNIKYINAINAGIIPEETENLSEQDYYNESILTALRTTTGLHIEQLPQQFRYYFTTKANEYLKTGRIVFDGTYKIPAQYFLISDSIISDFIIV